jgi:hypothetical protein
MVSLFRQDIEAIGGICIGQRPPFRHQTIGNSLELLPSIQFTTLKNKLEQCVMLARYLFEGLTCIVLNTEIVGTRVAPMAPPHRGLSCLLYVLDVGAL